MPQTELDHRLGRYGLNPCGEIIGDSFHCNLSEVHLNRLDLNDLQDQRDAFQAAALSVAVLLHHQFQEPRYQHARELDPIVGVSFTGLFDFFVRLFGLDWLKWWEAGRPESWGYQVLFTSPVLPVCSDTHADMVDQAEFFRLTERAYLAHWRNIVHETVWEYCDRMGLRRPNRCTTVQPSGTKSLLTNASPGWHPPKAQWFIRRITFRKDDPVALACIAYGYRVIPSQSDQDEQGSLLGDPFDPRCTEWLVEIPTAVPWADIPGVDSVHISKFSALAQFDFYMQVQRHYTTHNTSATIELREAEVEPLAERIYQAIQQDEGYISATLLARFDDLETFPRLPFEPITRETYEQLSRDVRLRRYTTEFGEAMLIHQN
jgi:ribonucleotide reductase class II